MTKGLLSIAVAVTLTLTGCVSTDIALNAVSEFCRSLAEGQMEIVDIYSN